MKKTLYILCITALAVACQKMTIETRPEGSDAMHFIMNHPATRATATDFEEGDRIGLYITSYDSSPVPLQLSGNWTNNVATVLSGSEWVTSKKVLWSEQKMDVYAYYPYMRVTSVDEQPFSVALDQNTVKSGETLGGYESSDFLWAKTGGVVKTEDITSVYLSFSHCLSKLVVKLQKGDDYEGDLPAVSELYIHNVVPDATIDFSTGSVTKATFGEPETIKAHRVDDETFEAIIVPQRLESRRPFIEYIAAGASYLLEDTFLFKAGIQHTISLVINSNPDQVAIEIGGSIEGGWTQ